MVAISETLQQEEKYNNYFHFFAGTIMALRVVRASNCNAKFGTVLGSIPAFFDTMESEGRQMKRKKSNAIIALNSVHWYRTIVVYITVLTVYSMGQLSIIYSLRKMLDYMLTSNDALSLAKGYLCKIRINSFLVTTYVKLTHICIFRS